MTRDYKTRARRKRRTSGPSPWLWATAGLGVGLFVAFLVYLQMRAPSVETPVTMEKPASAAVHDARASKKKAIPPPKPRFDFYNLLPEMEVIVPEQELTGAPVHGGVKQVKQPGTYLLQAGSFRSHEQADQLRARLALLGMETSIQSVTIDNRQTWHRVRVGPFHELGELNEARAQLRHNGVDAILIRLKD